MCRVLVVLLIIAAVVGGWIYGYPKMVAHKVELRAYFKDANGLRAGAPVRLAGVEIGRVTEVRVRPDLQATPAEVVMLLQTSYALKIPCDATVDLPSSGLFGETFAQIEIEGTSGAPVKSGAVLTEKPSKFNPGALIEKWWKGEQPKPCTPEKGGS